MLVRWKNTSLSPCRTPGVCCTWDKQAMTASKLHQTTLNHLLYYNAIKQIVPYSGDPGLWAVRLHHIPVCHKFGEILPLLFTRQACSYRPSHRAYHSLTSTKLYWSVTKANVCEQLDHSRYMKFEWQELNPIACPLQTYKLSSLSSIQQRGPEQYLQPFIHI